MKVKIHTKFTKDAILAEIDTPSTTYLANYLNDDKNEWLPTEDLIIRKNDIVSIQKVEN